MDVGPIRRRRDARGRSAPVGAVSSMTPGFRGGSQIDKGLSGNTATPGPPARRIDEVHDDDWVGDHGFRGTPTSTTSATKEASRDSPNALRPAPARRGPRGRRTALGVPRPEPPCGVYESPTMPRGPTPPTRSPRSVPLRVTTNPARGPRESAKPPGNAIAGSDALVGGGAPERRRPGRSRRCRCNAIPLRPRWGRSGCGTPLPGLGTTTTSQSGRRVPRTPRR